MDSSGSCAVCSYRYITCRRARTQIADQEGGDATEEGKTRVTRLSSEFVVFFEHAAQVAFAVNDAVEGAILIVALGVAEMPVDGSPCTLLHVGPDHRFQ